MYKYPSPKAITIANKITHHASKISSKAACSWSSNPFSRFKKTHNTEGTSKLMLCKKAVKEGSLIWVDRISTLGPKVHNLQGENDSVTPRVLELELSF